MELYGNGHSPATHSIRMLCGELESECDYFEIGLGATEPWLPEPLNPECRSPMLEDDGFLLAETNAILIYLAETSHNDLWYPTTQPDRALIHQWLSWQNSRLAPQVAQLAWQRRYAPDAARNEAQTQQAERWLNTLLPELEQRLQNREQLCTAHLTIADLAVAVQIDDLTTSGYALNHYPNTLRWLTTITTRPTYSRPHPPAE